MLSNTTQILKQAIKFLSRLKHDKSVTFHMSLQKHDSYCWIKLSEDKSRRGSKENISIE